MKSIVAILLLAALASASSLEGFRAWSKTHNKLYTSKESVRRYAIYKENLAKIERMNLDSQNAKFAPNQFSDLTVEEFTSTYTSGLRGRKYVAHPTGVAAPNKNADYSYMLPEVKDQASCGSCWAFSAVANMEAQTYKTNGGSVVSLSEQQLVSCDKKDSGCNGGEMYVADEYAVENGMTSTALLPYTSGSGSVAKCPSTLTAVADFKSFKHLTESGSLSDAQMIEYLEQYGPLSVGIAASSYYFQSYSEGILDNVKSCGKDLDHGVALVGYGTEGGVDYWLVRNSWGKTWGLKGYVKLARGNDMCGLNEDISTIIA